MSAILLSLVKKIKSFQRATLAITAQLLLLMKVGWLEVTLNRRSVLMERLTYSLVRRRLKSSSLNLENT
jgi:hypothetical protein